MTVSARSRAEERFSKATQREHEFQKERVKAEKASLEKTARLRALRIAKEAADAEAALEAAADKKPATGGRARKAKAASS